MHSDNRDREVKSIVQANNMVYVLDVKGGGLSDWVKTSGLTQEEAAMIQPGYPVDLDATFEELLSSDFTSNDVTISNVSVRGTRFNVDLPQTLADSPETFQTALDTGKALLDSNNVVGTAFQQQAGVLFGTGPTDAAQFLSVPNNLDQFIYFGTDDSTFGALVGTSRTTGNAGLVEIEYTLQANNERFSEFALTSILNATSGAGEINSAVGEQAGLFLRSEVYSVASNELAGVAELSTTGQPIVNGNLFTGISELLGNQFISIDSDSIRVVTYGLGLAPAEAATDPFLGSSSLNSFFHEFSTVAVPEPSSMGVIVGLLATMGLMRRREH